MKKLFIVIAFVSMSQYLFCQETAIYSQELLLSINRTALNNVDHQNKMGFGLGYHYLLRSNKMFGPTVGIEFNLNRYFAERGNYGQMYTETDVNVQNYDLSIPFGIQIRLLKFFVETGVFFDFNLVTKTKSTVYDYYYNEEGKPSMNTRIIESNRNEGTSVGICCLAGCIIPKTKDRCFIKAEYKYGLNDIYIDSNSNMKYLRLIIGYKI